MMSKLRANSLVLVFLASITGCSTSVRANKVYGTYTAKYPFGMATLTLNPDGKFVQTVVIEKEQPATISGIWSFDPEKSAITLRGAMPVVDGYGHLTTNWRTPDDLAAVPVERLWMKINIETSQEYPYIKN